MKIFKNNITVIEELKAQENILNILAQFRNFSLKININKNNRNTATLIVYEKYIKIIHTHIFTIMGTFKSQIDIKMNDKILEKRIIY